MEKELACSKLETRADDARCGKQCNKKRSCLRHKCGQKCCIDIDHVCPLICGRPLTCGLHRYMTLSKLLPSSLDQNRLFFRCADECHRGNCKSCPNVSFEELTCYCGEQVIYPPVACGVSPPGCANLCTRPHSCDHAVMHNCHTEENCPPCTFLTEKWCFGRHEVTPKK